MSRSQAIPRHQSRERLNRFWRAVFAAVPLLAALLVAIVFVAPLLPILGAGAATTGSPPPPLVASDFNISADRGFQNFGGSSDNTWSWAMKWWDGHLYVGTNRLYACFNAAALNTYAKTLANKVSDATLQTDILEQFPYPPPVPGQDCPSRDDMGPRLRAEIWRWTPGASITDNGTWSRVYQSPLDVCNPDAALNADGSCKLLPREVGFRGMEVYTEPDGSESLYVAGVSAKSILNGTVPPPRILRVTRDLQVIAVPQTPGTFLGDIPNSSNRALVSYKNMLFTIHGEVFGQGSIYASDNPALGDDAWFQASAGNDLYFEIEPFNGQLYAGTYEKGGYRVMRTDASGTAPFKFTEVVPHGGGLGDHPSPSVVSMHVFDGRLYVGTAEPSEIVRINPDDTWDLVLGAPRQLPDGTWKYPLSGVGPGFNDDFNEHLYRMGDDANQLYAGTFNSSIGYIANPKIMENIGWLRGYDLYRTASSGWYWSPITTSGLGDTYAMSARTFANTPFGLFLGTGDNFNGLSNQCPASVGGTPLPGQTGCVGGGGTKVYRAFGHTAEAIAAPDRVDATTHQGKPLLSWEPVPTAVKYHVLRAEILHIKIPGMPVYLPTPTAGPNGSSQTAGGNGQIGALPTFPPRPPGSTRSFPQAQVPTPTALPWYEDMFLVDRWYPSPFLEVGTTQDPVYLDSTTDSNAAPRGYLYLIQAEDGSGHFSPRSNVVLGPSLSPPITFTSLRTSLQVLQQRKRLLKANGDSIAGDTAIQSVQGAAKEAAGGQLAAAFDIVKTLNQQTASGTIAPEPEGTDIEMLTFKLMRQIRLARNGLVDQSALQ